MAKPRRKKKERMKTGQKAQQQGLISRNSKAPRGTVRIRNVQRAQVCIVFEGRDGAGKGGVIKAITERVSPRVFAWRLLARSDGAEKTQMHGQRYIAHFSGGRRGSHLRPQLVTTGAGRRRVMGFCTEDQAKRFCRSYRPLRIDGRIRDAYFSSTGSRSTGRADPRLEGRIDDGARLSEAHAMDLKSYDRWDDTPGPR